MLTSHVGDGAFVGRRRELADLVARRKAAARGRGCVVLVSGEAGSGKTRLIEEFAATLTHGRGRVIRLGANRWLGAAASPGASHAAERVRRALEEGFRRAAVVILEDAHEAARETLDVLVEFGAALQQSRLLLIVTYRRPDLDHDAVRMPLLARLARTPGAHSVELEPLAGEDIRALLREFASMAGTVLTGDAAGAIEDRCGGNPLLARELLLHASRRATRAGVLRRAAQTGDDDELPLSVRGLIAEWLAPFDDDERNVLQHAALLDDGFSVADISKIIPVAPEVVRAAVNRARSRRLIVEARDGRAFYRFRHRVVADALEGNFLAHESAALHARIAQAIEATGDVESRADDLARHWTRAGNNPMAATYAEKAGDCAYASARYAEAARWYESAAGAGRAAKTRPHYVYEKLARALDRSGNPLGSHLALRAAAAGLEAAGEVERAVRLRLDDALLAQHQSDLPAALSRLDAAQRFGLPETSQRYAQAVAAFLLALRDEPERALELTADFPVDDPATEPAALSKYWEVITYVAVLRADAGTFRSAAAKCLEVARRNPDPAVAAAAESDIAISTMHFADVACDALFERAIALAQEHGVAWIEAYTHAFAALNDFVRGRLEAARHHLRAATASEAEMPMLVIARLFAGLATGRARCDDELLADCARPELIEAAFGTGIASVFGRVAGPYAQWLADAGRLDAARAVLHRCVVELRSAYGTFLTMPVVAKYADGDDVLQARRLLEDAARNSDDRIAAATLSLFDALWEERTGNDAGARASASEAAEQFRSMGWTGMQAWAEEIAGERARALRLYRQCGNLREVRRLELADSESAGLKHNTELKHGAGLPHGEGLPDGAGPQQHESADGLSSRERRIVALVVEGKSNRSIATTLELSEKTVERHLTSIFEKLGFRSRTELATSVVAQRPTRLSPIGDVPRL